MAKHSKQSTGPFDVKLSDDKRRDLTEFLCTELQGALDHRQDVGQKIDYAYALYEQQRTRGRGTDSRADEPYVDGADLTSFIPCEKVDALTARAVRTIFAEPIWVVEGIGASAGRAPIVEEFHQWKAESERLQVHVARAIKMALIERRSALEVYEGTQLRRVRKRMSVYAKTEPDPTTGQPMVQFDDKGEPALMQDEAGAFVEAKEVEGQPETQLVVEVDVESWDRVRKGPQYRVLGNREFVILPEHAKQREDTWGWAKRFWKRVPQLKEWVKQGQYDKKAVESLSEVSERDGTDRDENVAPQTEPETAEKELWEVTFLRDLDDDGFEEWYIATVSLVNRMMLRLKRDDLGQQRFILLIPFTRPETELDGYSVVLDKLLTISEEHTSRRNMIADRSALATGAPVMRQEGAAWDPELVPWGPRAIIPFNNPNELKQMDIRDVPESAWRLVQESIESAERVVGLNDASLGVNPQASRTLGEFQAVQGYSEIRIEEMLMNLREALEDLFQVRHAMYLRQLEDGGADGEAVPKEVQVGLERRLAESDVSFDGLFRPELLRGQFRGKPRNSVESADPNLMRADFNQFLQALAQLMQVNPMLAQMLSSPQATQAILEHALRVYRFPDRQAILGSAMQMMQQMAQQQQMGGQPGMPPGMPPQGMSPAGAPTSGGMPPPGAAMSGGPMPAGAEGPSPLAGQVAQAVLARIGG